MDLDFLAVGVHPLEQAGEVATLRVRQIRRENAAHDEARLELRAEDPIDAETEDDVLDVRLGRPLVRDGVVAPEAAAGDDAREPELSAERPERCIEGRSDAAAPCGAVDVDVRQIQRVAPGSCVVKTPSPVASYQVCGASGSIARGRISVAIAPTTTPSISATICPRGNASVCARSCSSVKTTSCSARSGYAARFSATSAATSRLVTVRSVTCGFV